MSNSTFGTLNYYISNYNLLSNEFWRTTGDQRTINYPLVRDGPWQCFAIMTMYLLFVLKFGREFMKNKPAFELRTIMMIYNISMVIANGFFFFESLKWLKYGRELFNLQFPDKYYITSELTYQSLTFYLYYLSKYVDLLDTVFFVLRKKYSQITPLHLYHHTAVPILGNVYSH